MTPNIFSRAIEDIFAVPEFTEFLYADSGTITVSSYSSSTDAQHTEFGFDPGESVSVTAKVADWQPQRGDKVKFRGKEWKVDTVQTDSHNLTNTVYLKSLESK